MTTVNYNLKKIVVNILQQKKIKNKKSFLIKIKNCNFCIEIHKLS